MKRKAHSPVCFARRESGSGQFVKEVHYFDRVRMENNHGANITANEFKSLFSHCRRTDLIVEMTPANIFYPDVIRKQYIQNPIDYSERRLKLILILREPVSRALSWFNHMRCAPVEHPVDRDPSALFEHTEQNNKFHIYRMARRLGFEEYVNGYLLPALKKSRKRGARCAQLCAEQEIPRSAVVQTFGKNSK